MNSDISPNNNQSVEGRDYKFETEVMERMYVEYVKKYIKRIQRMDEEKTYVNDNSFHNVESNNHIMYKCKVGPNGETKLSSGDGKRGYEFLVEFDKDDPEYGIYYGCRGLIYSEDQQEQIDIFLYEWENYIKPEVCAVLNNTFIDIDFTNRFQATNNASNKTFWPFWIALGEDEDVVEVAARATKLIANVYIRFLSCLSEGKSFTTKARKKKTKDVQTRYTEHAYYSILDTIEKKCCSESREKFIKFIENAQTEGIIEKDDRYEMCWKFTQKNVVVIHLINELCNRLSLKLKNNKISGECEEKVPWQYFTPIFLSTEDEPFDSIKQHLSLSNQNGAKDNINIANEILLKLKIDK